MLLCAGLLPQGCGLTLTAQRSSVPCASVRDSQLPQHLGALVVRNLILVDPTHLSAYSAAASTSGTGSSTNLCAAPLYQRAVRWCLSPLVFRGATVNGLMELPFSLFLTAALSLGTLRVGTPLRRLTLPQRLNKRLFPIKPKPRNGQSTWGCLTAWTSFF